MQKVSIGFAGLSAAASSALIQSVVEQLAPEGVVVIDRDENGADITVLDKGEFFVLPDGDTLTVEGGVPTIASKWFTDTCAAFNERYKEWENAYLSGLGLRTHRNEFIDFSAAVKGGHITAPILSSVKVSGDTLVGSHSDTAAIKPRIRTGATEETDKCPLSEIHDRINGLVSQVATLSDVVYGMSAK